MNLERYQVTFSPDLTKYEFVSEGRHGRILKVVDFKPIGEPMIFNLAFGDYDLATDSISYSAVSDNGDGRKVLATVAAITLVFLRSKPGAEVYAEGSTLARTRLYQMELGRHLVQLPEHLEALGQTERGWEAFVRNKNYQALLVKWK